MVGLDREAGHMECAAQQVEATATTARTADDAPEVCGGMGYYWPIVTDTCTGSSRITEGDGSQADRADGRGL